MNCPHCRQWNKVTTEVWFHGVVSYFTCVTCDTMFAQLVDGEWDEHNSYQDWLKDRVVVYSHGGVKTISKET